MHDDEINSVLADGKTVKRGNLHLSNLRLGKNQNARIAEFDRAVIADMDKPTTTRGKV